MIRTQVQLTESQMQALKALAAERSVSVAYLVRSGVDRILAAEREPSALERRRRAQALFGTFSSGRADLAERHDEYAVEAFEDGSADEHGA